MLLFCLPCAGGSSSMYFPWTRKILCNTKIVPLELKGHARKVQEKLSRSIGEEVEAILNDIRPIIRGNEYSIFGHSMGGLLTYELYYKIVCEKLPIPNHLFFSSSIPPHILKHMGIASHLLSDEELLNHCVSIGGISDEILSQKSILEYFIPIIRNDYKLMDEYVFQDKREPIASKTSVFRGMKDSISLDESKEWKCLIAGGCNVTEFEGNHFYLLNQQNNLLSLIDKMFDKRNLEHSELILNF